MVTFCRFLFAKKYYFIIKNWRYSSFNILYFITKISCTFFSYYWDYCIITFVYQLFYSDADELFDRNLKTMIDCMEMTASLGSQNPMMQIKPSGLFPLALCVCIEITLYIQNSLDINHYFTTLYKSYNKFVNRNLFPLKFHFQVLNRKLWRK